MNYTEMVREGKSLVKNYDEVRYKIARLACKVRDEMGVSVTQFAKDININHSTLKSWVRHEKSIIRPLRLEGYFKDRDPTKEESSYIGRVSGIKNNSNTKEIVNQYEEVKRLYNLDTDKLHCIKFMKTMMFMDKQYKLELFNVDELIKLRTNLMMCKELLDEL